MHLFCTIDIFQRKAGNIFISYEYKMKDERNKNT